jgi:hypothetical protein
MRRRSEVKLRAKRAMKNVPPPCLSLPLIGGFENWTLPLIGGFMTSTLLLIGGFSERPAGWDERGDHGGGDGVRDQLQDVLPPLLLLPLRLSQGQQHP